MSDSCVWDDWRAFSGQFVDFHGHIVFLTQPTIPEPAIAWPEDHVDAVGGMP